MKYECLHCGKKMHYQSKTGDGKVCKYCGNAIVPCRRFCWPIRYAKNTGALHIGGRQNKLTIFTLEHCARLEIGKRTWHFGNWD
ncbi:MAG: hypothetical protein EOM54_13520 [Clostridia bacterium]|nr:hypothetical protein [Clostridia bacterium]